MGGGAIIAAAKQRQVQEVVDTFRLADATAPDRAQSLETLALTQSGEVRNLIVEGVLMPGTREGTFYLSEVGYIYKRNDRRWLKAVAIVLAIALAIGILIIPIAAT